AETHFAFDYLNSLGLWLRPTLTIRTAHKLLCLQAVVSIIEAVLFDRITRDIYDSLIKNELSRMPADRVRKILCKKGLLNDEWTSKFGKLYGLRNLIHLSKDRRTKRQEVDEYKISDLEKLIDDFNGYIKKSY